MKENTDSRILTTELIYTLDVRIPDQTPKRLTVSDRLLAGIDPRNDLVLVDPKIKAKHFLFRRRNNVFTVHYLGKDNETFLNGAPLENGKLYILEKSDILKVGKIEIIIRRETGISKSTTSSPPSPLLGTTSIDELANLSDFNSENDRPQIAESEAESGRTVFKEVPIKKIEALKKEPIFNFSTIKLIPYKFYGFIVDFALTYFLLAFVIPSLGLLSITQDFLLPISDFISNFLMTQQSEISSLKILSLLEFLVFFHSLMIFCSLTFGSTPGAFLIGLHSTGSIRNVFTKRFKAYIYALLNVAALPLIIFDLPFYKGRTIKEILSFSEREINNSTFFKALRRAIVPMIVLVSLFSPFFLPPPFNVNISNEKNITRKFKETHTTNILSSSKKLGISLNSEMNNQFAILPFLGDNKTGLVFYDFKSKKSLIMEEEKRSSVNLSLFKLRYSNPFASLRIPNKNISSSELKNKSLISLDLAITKLEDGVLEYGPFFANAFLYKEFFLENFGEIDYFVINRFTPKNPVIKISTTKRIDKVFLFTPEGIIEYSLTGPKKFNLFESFTSEVLSGFTYGSESKIEQNNPQVLEVLDAFLNKDYSTILTYYINEAKKVQAVNNLAWSAFFIRNMKQSKQALISDKNKIGINKNIEKSFDEIIDTF